MQLLEFLYEYIQEIVCFVLLVAVLLINHRKKAEPERDIKNEPSKTLNQRMHDALRRAIFDDDESIN